MDSKEKKAFSIVARLGSTKYALRGIRIFVKNTHNAWIEIFAGVVAAMLGFYFLISSGEWIALILSFGVLLMAEGFNTAIEVHMNLTSPGQNQYARDTKDIAAGAVFIAALTAVAVLCIIFLPKIFSF